MSVCSKPEAQDGRGGRVVRVVVRMMVRVVIGGPAVAHGGGREPPVEAVRYGVGGGRRAPGA